MLILAKHSVSNFVETNMFGDSDWPSDMETHTTHHILQCDLVLLPSSTLPQDKTCPVYDAGHFGASGREGLPVIERNAGEDDRDIIM